MSKEIGGYLELDVNTGSIYHDDAIALISGRAALQYLIKLKKIRKIFLPFFICDSVVEACRKEHIYFEFYHIDRNFRPIFGKKLGTNEWLYIVNFYGQIDNLEIEDFNDNFSRVIVDNAHAYFQQPVKNVDTLYTCRKFLGVADGAFLYTDGRIKGLKRDESFERIRFVLGRFERSAREFYHESSENNRSLSIEPIKLMSRLTDNLLRAIDYDFVKKRRTDNFTVLHGLLKEHNVLTLAVPDGAYMYPFYCENGLVLRAKLQNDNIFIPTLWPEVITNNSNDYLENDYAASILPLPVDQRYDFADMLYIVRKLQAYQQ